MKLPGRLRKVLWLAMPLLAWPLAGAAEGDWGLEVLMRELASQHGDAGIANYTEIKTLASLREPLKAEGVLRYRFPSSLEKEVHRPRVERYVIHGDSMEIYRNGELKRQVRLADYASLQLFVNSFIATLGGDLAGLRRYYTLLLEGTRADWTLQLMPIDPELQRVVKRITVHGQGDRILSFETLQPNDDSSKMLITSIS